MFAFRICRMNIPENPKLHTAVKEGSTSVLGPLQARYLTDLGTEPSQELDFFYRY